MIGDAISPIDRLSPNRWEHRLSLLFFVTALLLCLALMCENVNAMPLMSRCDSGETLKASGRSTSRGL